jgi:hypothetical protein
MSRSQYIKGFYVINRAWYAQPLQQPELMIGLYHSDGGTSGEFAIKWHDLSPYHNAPRLEIFDDAWQVFFAMPELAFLAKLRESRRTQDDIIEFLLRAGFQDLTAYADDARVPL